MTVFQAGVELSLACFPLQQIAINAVLRKRL